jgi:anti-sigma factor (TIGR02949 family)
LLTCKEFLDELSEYLDETAQGEVRKKLEAHVSECPNCWVIVDTTKKTLQIYKGMEPQAIPEELHSRLMKALEKKMVARR